MDVKQTRSVVLLDLSAVVEGVRRVTDVKMILRMFTMLFVEEMDNPVLPTHSVAVRIASEAAVRLLPPLPLLPPPHSLHLLFVGVLDNFVPVQINVVLTNALIALVRAYPWEHSVLQIRMIVAPSTARAIILVITVIAKERA